MVGKVDCIFISFNYWSCVNFALPLPPQLEFFANANYGSDMASGTVLLLLLAFSSLSASKFLGPQCNC